MNRASWLATALVLASLTAPRALTAQPAPPSQARAALTVLSKEGRRPLPIATVNGRDMVSLGDLATTIPFAIREDAAAGGIIVAVDAKSIILSMTQPLASIDGRLISLTATPVRRGDAWLVPLDFIDRALATIAPVPVDLHRASGFLVVGGLRVPRVVVRFDATGAVPALTFGITPRATHSITQEPGRLLVRFEADAVDADIVMPPPGDVVAGATLLDEGTTIAVALGPRFASFRASEAPVGDTSQRLVVELVPAADTTAPPPMPTAQPQAPLELSSNAFETVVIDPGHGGDDIGAQGAGGTLEKEVTLAVARRLKAALESRLGLHVLLTRDADTAVPIDDRAALANNNKADLFVSLHANASRRPDTRGAEIFVHEAAAPRPPADPTSPGDRRVLPLFSGGIREVELVPWDQAQERHIEESRLFARYLEEEFGRRQGDGARPTQFVPVRVLASANMPAALVELGFLTNADEEQQMRTPARQNELAQAIYESLVRFRASHDAGTAPAPR